MGTESLAGLGSFGTALEPATTATVRMTAATVVMGMTATVVLLATSVAATAVTTALSMGMLLGWGAALATVRLLMVLLWVLILLPGLLLPWASVLICHLYDSSLSQMNLLFKDTRFELPIIFITFKLQNTFKR